jgi:hypothetical protein
MATAKAAPDKDAAAGSFGLAFIYYLRSVTGHVQRVVIEKSRAVIEMFTVEHTLSDLVNQSYGLKTAQEAEQAQAGRSSSARRIRP